MAAVVVVLVVVMMMMVLQHILSPVSRPVASFLFAEAMQAGAVIFRCPPSRLRFLALVRKSRQSWARRTLHANGGEALQFTRIYIHTHTPSLTPRGGSQPANVYTTENAE